MKTRYYRSRGAKGCWQWIPSCRDTFPVNAVSGGVCGGNKLFVARATHERNLTPGRFSPVHRMAFIPYIPPGEEGREIGKFSYEILVATPETVKWIYCDFQSGQIEPNLKAVVGGYSEYFHETLYIGRWLESAENCLIGCIWPSRKTCYVPYQNNVLKIQNQCQILVEC